MKLFQAALFRTSSESSSTNCTVHEQELARIRCGRVIWRKNLSIAHRSNHELNQLIPMVATQDYLYSTLEYELRRKADPEHKILITEIFDEAEVRALLNRHGIGSADCAGDPEPADQDRRRAQQLLRRLYEQRDEGWVYERAVVKLKRYYLVFHALVVGILLGWINLVIASTDGNLSNAPEQLRLAMLAGALGATLAATFKVRDTVVRLNDLPAAFALAVAQAVIGGALGFTAWLLLESDVIQIAGDANQKWKTLGLVAFASGFSEPLILGIDHAPYRPSQQPSGGYHTRRSRMISPPNPSVTAQASSASQ